MATPPFTIDETLPSDNDIVSQHPSGARTFRDVVESYLNTDHNPTTGHHKFAGLDEQSSDPANVANTGFLYTKDDGGDTELYYKDDDGTVTQIIKDGGINYDEFPSSTKMLFAQATAPTGWTKITTAARDLSVFRLVTTTTFAVGGVHTFATVFSVSKATESHVLSEAEMPAHTHTLTAKFGVADQTPTGASSVFGSKTLAPTTSSTGGGGGHTHDITMDPRFQDVIMAIKD